MGVLESNKAVAVFTYTQSESAELLRSCSALTPGSPSAVIRAKFDHKYMGTNSTTTNSNMNICFQRVVKTVTIFEDLTTKLSDFKEMKRELQIEKAYKGSQ